MPQSASSHSRSSFTPIITTTAPVFTSHSECDVDKPESRSVTQNAAILSAGANVTPKVQDHGTSPTYSGGRHTRRNNSGDLQTLHAFEAAFPLYMVVSRTTREVAQSKASKRKKAEKESKDLLARIIEGVKKAKEHNDECQSMGQEIMSLEGEIKAIGYSIPEQHRRLDSLYRDKMRHAEAEKKVHDDYDIVNNLAVLAAMKSADEPAPRNGAPKSRKGQRPIVESDVIVDSPGPSPSDGRPDLLKRVKGASQRSSSVASQNRAVAPPKDDGELNRGVQAEKAGQLVVGTEVFYKFPRGSKEPEGEGIHVIIKKVWPDKKPIQYDVRDPEDDAIGKQNVRKVIAKELVLIPTSGAGLPIFPNASKVYAKYPETDTFYNAEVRNFTKGMYTLIFEGEEDNKEMAVDKRFVLDTRLK